MEKQIGTRGTFGTRYWKVPDEVYPAIDRGEYFYTVGPRTRKEAAVEKWRCSCGRLTLRSSPDATTDNNLDNLPRCP